MKRSPLRKISQKRQLENRLRAMIMFDKFGPRAEWTCMVRDIIGGTCYGPINGHEIRKRSQGGSITDPDNIVLACNKHNDWIEDNPNEAHKYGLVLYSWEQRDDTGEG